MQGRLRTQGTSAVMAAFLFCLGADVALSQTKGLGISDRPTELSGRRGAETVLAQSPPSDFAVVGIQSAERSDDPCFLEVRYRHVETGEEIQEVFAACADRSDGRGKRASIKEFNLPDFQWAVGARVCMNRDRTKIKGMQLIGDYENCILGAETIEVPAPCSRNFRAGGSDQGIPCLDPEDRSRVELICGDTSLNRGFGTFFERRNCPGRKVASLPDDENWEREVFCPDGYVASGVQLSTAAGGGDRRMINGVGLHCRELTTFKSRKTIVRGN